MDKIAIIGDLHIDQKDPALFSKLDQVYSIAHTNNCSAIVCTGDVFNRKTISIPFLVEVIDFFKKHADEDKDLLFYSVAGNHDLYYGRADSLFKTPLGVLFSSGAIKHGVITTTYGSTISCIDYDRAPQDKITLESDITAMHKYMHSDYKSDEDYVDYKAIEVCGAIACGHDHNSYEPVSHKGKILVRPGSLMRCTSSIEDQQREIVVDIIGVENKGSRVVSYIDRVRLDIEPCENIYSEQKLASKEYKKGLISFIEDMKKAPSKRGDSVKILKDLCKGNKVLYDTCSEYLRTYSII